jgi:hypothetical protein
LCCIIKRYGDFVACGIAKFFEEQLRKQSRTGNGNLILRIHVQPQIFGYADEFACQSSTAQNNGNFVSLLFHSFDYVSVFTHEFCVDWVCYD